MAPKATAGTAGTNTGPLLAGTKTTAAIVPEADIRAIPPHIREQVLACLMSPDTVKLDKLTAAIIAAARGTHVPSRTPREHGSAVTVDTHGVVVVNAGHKGSIDPHEVPKRPESYAEYAKAAELSKPRSIVPGVNDSSADLRDFAHQFARK